MIPKITILGLLLLFFSGYYPAGTFPPLKSSTVSASQNIQEDQILIDSFSKPLILPHPGYLSTKFSTFHPGIDLASGLGMPVHPITDGTVDEANYGFFGYGNHIIISHEKGIKSLYGHLGRIFVKKGQSITSDSIIAEVGLTGRTSGPHTHLEITFNGKYIDPVALLPKMDDIPKPEYLTAYKKDSPQKN